MRKLFYAAGAVALMLAGLMAITPASAADKGGGTKGSFVYDAPASVHNWTAFYGSLGVGITSVNSDIGFGLDGYHYGGRVGADIQLGLSPLVIGAFADYTQKHGSAPFNIDAREWSYGARMGVAVGSRQSTLIYGLIARPNLKIDGMSGDLTGLQFGGGIETMLHRNWSISLEATRTTYDDLTMVREWAFGPRMTFRWDAPQLKQ